MSRREREGWRETGKLLERTTGWRRRQNKTLHALLTVAIIGAGMKSAQEKKVVSILDMCCFSPYESIESVAPNGPGRSNWHPREGRQIWIHNRSVMLFITHFEGLMLN